MKALTGGEVNTHEAARREKHALPWYVVPDYMTRGRSAQVVDSRGEQVAAFEDIGHARSVVALMNGGQ